MGPRSSFEKRWLGTSQGGQQVFHFEIPAIVDDCQRTNKKQDKKQNKNVCDSYDLGMW